MEGIEDAAALRFHNISCAALAGNDGSCNTETACAEGCSCERAFHFRAGLQVYGVSAEEVADKGLSECEFTGTNSTRKVGKTAF